jgi:hypothetical protein
VNVTNVPLPAPRALYDESIAAYAALVSSRAIAVYQVGNVRYPGLSDVDLLVVPKAYAADNRYFFSAFHRAPRRSLALYLHEPFVVPPGALDAMRYTTHSRPRLLYGEDILSGLRPIEDRNEPLCRVLESYCSYERFARRTRSSGHLSGRWAIAITSAFRFFLTDFDAAFKTELCAAYALAIDSIRASAFDRPTADAIVEAWDLFNEHFGDAEHRLRDEIASGTSAEISDAARAILCGDRTFRDLSPDYARTRRATIAHYHDELERLGFPYGHLFFVAAYDGSVRTVASTPYARYVARYTYRLQRRIGEYVHG